MHKFLLLYSWLIRFIFCFLPDEPRIMRLRGFFYGIFMPKVGRDFQVSGTAIIKSLENLYVGENVYLAPNVIVNAGSDIYLESEVMIGFNSVLVAGNHTLINGSYRFGESQKAPIKIGFGSWVGANCTILPGVTIGCGTLIAANSAVVKSCSQNCIYGGVPAIKIREGVRGS